MIRSLPFAVMWRSLRSVGFSARRWLAKFEAAGGRFVPMASGAFALTPWPTGRAQRLADTLSQNKQHWLAVYRLACRSNGGEYA